MDDTPRRTGGAKHSKPALDILLDHIHTASHATKHCGIVDLHTIPMATLAGLQMREQCAIGASEIKHACARRNPVGDQGQIRPQAPGGVGADSCEYLRAMRSK